MATMFRQDITQSVEPAAADTSGLARAGQATANIFKTLEGVTGEMAEGYQKGIIENISNEAFGITEQFLQDNMVSQQAAEKAGQVSAARGKAAQAFEEQMFDPNAADWTEIEKRGKTVLGKFDEQLQRLKLASQGGMSQDQYVARVSALTREAIGKYPGLTDKIRASVGTVTGLEGADRWAEMQFVKRMFSATKSDTPSEMDFVKKDIDDMSAVGTYGSREQLWNEYSTDREAYNRKVYGFKQYQAAKTQTDGIKNFVEGAQAQSDLDADQVRAGFTAIFSGNLGSLVLNEATSNKENVWSQTLQSMAQGGSPEIDPVKFKVQIDAHNVQMRTNIEKSRQTSLQSLDVYFANNPNISSKKRDEMRADINNAADVALRTYADDKGVGLGAMAAVLSTYRDKSLKEQSELVDLAIKQQTAMQNNTLVMAYWSGGAQRENLKKTQPHFYAFMENQERLLTSSVFGVRDIIQGATDLSTVNNGFKNAADNPGAVPTPPEQDPKVTRAFHEGLMATARTTVDKADKGNVLTPSEVNIISSAIATSIDTGANGRLLMTDYKKLGEKIGKMPEAESAVIKDNASSAMQTTVAKIQGIKRNLEAKYGVTMQIGVNSAGQIAAVIPVNLQNRPLTQPAQPNLQTAISEFNKTTAALTNNIVYGRSMLTGEDVKAVGADFANVINSGQGYGGFFSLAAQPVAGAGRGVVNPPMAGGEQPAAAQPAASSGTLSVGDVVNGYKYLGGDPNSEASWSAQ